MTGMNRAIGTSQADEVSHIQQSVHDILTTPVGSRLMRRDYGSLLPELIDQPTHQATRLRLMSATVMALMLWEPRLAITSVVLNGGMNGESTLDISATRRTGPRAGQPISIVHPIK